MPPASTLLGLSRTALPSQGNIRRRRLGFASGLEMGEQVHLPSSPSPGPFSPVSRDVSGPFFDLVPSGLVSSRTFAFANVPPRAAPWPVGPGPPIPLACSKAIRRSRAFRISRRILHPSFPFEDRFGRQVKARTPSRVAPSEKRAFRAVDNEDIGGKWAGRDLYDPDHHGVRMLARRGSGARARYAFAGRSRRSDSPTTCASCR